MSPPRAATPVTVAMIAIAGDPEAAKKALRFVPKGSLSIVEECVLADLQHTEAWANIGYMLTTAAARGVNAGWPKAEDVKPAPAPATGDA